MNKKISLILSLGSAPDVVRSTIRAFRVEKGIEFDEVVLVCNTNLKSGDGSAALERSLEGCGLGPHVVRRVFTNSDDLLTKEQNLEFFRLVYGELGEMIAAGGRVIVNIAGGRKQMSALLLAAAYLAGVDSIYHTYFDMPEAGGAEGARTGLIEIPHLRIGSLLRFVVGEYDLDHRFGGSVSNLMRETETEEAFKILNGYLDEQSRYRSLRDEFRTRRPLYQSVLGVGEMIIRDLLADKLMFYPEYQHRVKDFDSFFQKVLRKERAGEMISDPFARFSDLAGLRVVLFNSDDLRKAVEIVGSSGDFVQFRTGGPVVPDDKSVDFGYRAVHLDACLNPDKRCHLGEYRNLRGVPFEVQFTTVFAHAWSRTHHVLSYKDKRAESLTAEQEIELGREFKKIALRLQDVEDAITDLANKFHPRNFAAEMEE